jgi:hypothetical protein
VALVAEVQRRGLVRRDSWEKVSEGLAVKQAARTRDKKLKWQQEKTREKQDMEAKNLERTAQNTSWQRRHWESREVGAAEGRGKHHRGTQEVAWQDVAWEAQLARLVAYKAAHADCNVPVGYAEDPRLATWVHNQRACKRKLDCGKPSQGMTAERAARLTALGLV